MADQGAILSEVDKYADATAAEKVAAQKAADDAELAKVRADYDATVADLKTQIANVPPPTPATDPAVLPYWGAPTWRDEFDDPKGLGVPDPANWNVRDVKTFGDYPTDKATIRKEQITVRDGKCILTLDWQTKVTTNGQDRFVKTGFMDQVKRGLPGGGVEPYKQLAGRWEMRANFPTGPHTQGLGAFAWWVRNGQKGEIDIIEVWGYDRIGDTRFGTIKSGTTSIFNDTGNAAAGSKKYTHLEQNERTPDPADGFHIYGFEYTPKHCSLDIDGLVVFTTTPRETPNLWNKDYFGTPFYMLINAHVGSTATYPTANPATLSTDKSGSKATVLPVEYQIDYVRCWKMPS